MSDRTPARQSARDRWRQSETAMTVAGEVADLLFGRRLPQIDPKTRAEIMEATDEFIAALVEDYAPDDSYDCRADAMQAWRDRQEQEDR